MNEDELELLREDKGIIRNRLKIYSARRNAKVFLEIQEEFKDFDSFLWSFVDYKQIVNHHSSLNLHPPMCRNYRRLAVKRITHLSDAAGSQC